MSQAAHPKSLWSPMASANSLLPSMSLPSNLRTRGVTQRQQPRLGRARAPPQSKPRKLVVRVTSSLIQEPLASDPSSLFLISESIGYSTASYYTSLGLFVISVPGLWSLIKRSVKSKVVQKTFIGEGEGKKVPNQVAGEILSFFTRNNFKVLDKGETIT